MDAHGRDDVLIHAYPLSLHLSILVIPSHSAPSQQVQKKYKLPSDMNLLLLSNRRLQVRPASKSKSDRSLD